jgi:Flp pilus assembly pilin Flp
MMSQKRNKGQSTVEYIILVSAVIAVALLFLGRPGGKDGKFRTTLEGSFNQMANQLTNVTNRLVTSL